MWQVCVDAPRSAAEQMACDVERAHQERLSVRMFTWDPPAISLGYRQVRPDWLDADAWQRQGLEHVERPTGGGMTFHGSDVSVAAVIPRSLHVPLHVLMAAMGACAVTLCEAYGADAEVCRDAEWSAERITYCLTETNVYAVRIGTRKVAGFALRRYPQSWLIHGSLVVRPLPHALAKALPAQTKRDLAHKAIPLAVAVGANLTAHDVAMRWAENWITWWDEAMLHQMALVAD